MKYFLKYSYYVIMGTLFAIVLSVLIGDMKWELIPIIIINAFMIRLLDDCFDYGKDKKAKNKKQPLSFKQLIWLTTALGVVYFIINIVSYGLWGLFSLLMILYMVIENKHETLKIFFVSVASMYYIGAYRELASAPIIIYLILMVLLSAGFYIYKRQKRTKKGVRK